VVGVLLAGGGQVLVGLLPPGGRPCQFVGAVRGGLVKPAAQPVAFGAGLAG
jgi:hypothetical protein